jgi:hypothetical protein
MTREYIVFDYTDVKDVKLDDPTFIRFFSTDDLFDWIDENKDTAFVVYKLGKCLIDWS